MSYLQNDGSIIVDCVLTDTGRMRLAKGNFKIAKFAAIDDEIVYSQYNKQHASGSAYYDLSILQTPIFEAFTNNTSVANSKLITIARTNLLYLPVMKINDLKEPMNSVGAYIVAVDKDTETSFTNYPNKTGVIFGETLNTNTAIQVDQGLDTSEISANFAIDSDLVETQYIVEIDNRFAKIVAKNSTTAARMSYIDDDNIASYYLSLGTDTEFVVENDMTENNNEVIAGPRGTSLIFRLQSSLELNTSSYLFTQIGSTATINGVTMKYIDSYIRINGATTGFRLDIPVRFCKL